MSNAAWSLVDAFITQFVICVALQMVWDFYMRRRFRREREAFLKEKAEWESRNEWRKAPELQEVVQRLDEAEQSARDYWKIKNGG